MRHYLIYKAREVFQLREVNIPRCLISPVTCPYLFFTRGAGGQCLGYKVVSRPCLSHLPHSKYCRCRKLLLHVRNLISMNRDPSLTLSGPSVGGTLHRNTCPWRSRKTRESPFNNRFSSVTKKKKKRGGGGGGVKPNPVKKVFF